MRREVTLEEISDGKLYDANDMVKADCQDCKGCCDCCKGMGDSVLLDPYDVCRLSRGLQRTPEDLIGNVLELGISDGNILPHLAMKGAEERCVFLNEEGRCVVHAIRPGFCRLFPLGRYYSEEGFKYILQIHECTKKNRSKIKVKKWLDTPNLKTYETYISDWHFFLKDLQDYVMKLASDQTQTDSDNTAKTISMHVLTQFYLTPYQPDGNFYDEFYARLEKSRLFTSSLHI